MVERTGAAVICSIVMVLIEHTAIFKLWCVLISIVYLLLVSEYCVVDAARVHGVILYSIVGIAAAHYAFVQVVSTPLH